MRDVIGWVLAVGIVGMGLFLLGAIFRFSVVTAFRTRGSAANLRSPRLADVEEVCGFALPIGLSSLYREAPFIERLEFELVDRTADPPMRWTIGAFNALTAPVVREWRAISGVSGVPIADDMDKGVYFVDQSGAILLASPNVPGGRALVARNVEAFCAFEAREFPEDDA